MLMSDNSIRQNSNEGLNNADDVFENQSFKQIYLKGLVMGLSDSVPGVSGATIALITNIYERLITAIASVNLFTLYYLLTQHRGHVWRNIDGNFLLILGLGVLSGILISARTILFLYSAYPEPLYAFFMGLVLTSAWVLRKKFRVRKFENWLMWSLGVIFSLILSNVEALVAEIGYVYIFICGMIAICAMILPGLSGALILILLGAYEFVLTALVALQFNFILVFSLGCLTGLAIFSRVLIWVLQRFRELTYALINGMLVGSTYMLWPWQKFYGCEVGNEESGNLFCREIILPLHYTEATGNPMMIPQTLFAFLLATSLVIYLHDHFLKKRN